MDIKNFAIIKGEDVKVDKGHIKIPTPKKIKKDGKNTLEDRQGIEIRSDVLFTNGTIEFKFKTTSHTTGILLVFNSVEEVKIVIGLSKHWDSFIIGGGTSDISPYSKAGSFKNYSLSEIHSIRIEIKGSYAKLYVDEILMCETIVNVKEAYTYMRLSSDGALDLYDFKIHAIKPIIFVVMQFSKEYNELFDDVIRPITEHAGFECIRADEFYTSTPILKDIIESIQNSTAIIAEITPDNPNVFYEIGYSHAISKPTILLCDRKREKLPFDISSFRTLFYDNTIAGKKKVEESLKKYLANIK